MILSNLISAQIYLKMIEKQVKIKKVLQLQ